MERIKLTLPNVLRALRYMSFMLVTLGTLMVFLAWGFNNVDEKAQLSTYLMMSSFVFLPHLIDIYDWLLEKCSPNAKEVRD